jgi:broad specificity phosphatase PhoE
MQKPTTIYLVRHGQSEASVAQVYGTDTPLTPTGLKQAEAAARHFAHLKLDKIIASPLKRAQQTATIIARPHHLEIITRTRLGEPHYGALEGQKRSEARASYPAFQTRDTLTDEARLDFKIVDDMESDREALGRFQQALREVAEQSAGQTILIISHVPLMKLLLMSLRFATRAQLAGESVDNAGVIKLTYEGGQFRVTETTGVHVQPA